MHYICLVMYDHRKNHDQLRYWDVAFCKTLCSVYGLIWYHSFYNAIVTFASFSKKNRDKASLKNQGEKLNFLQVWRIDIVLTSWIQSICTSFLNKASNETLAITHHRAKVTYQYLNRYQFYQRSYVSRQILWILGLWYDPNLTYGISCTLSSELVKLEQRN